MHDSTSSRFMLSSLLLLISTGIINTADAETQITVMGYRSGSFPENYQKAVIDPFEKQHPDIKVKFYPVQNAAFSLGILRSQKNAPQTDAVIIDLSVAKIARDENLLAKLDMANIPNASQINSIGRELGDYALPLTYDTYALLYNTQAIPVKPDSWNALWDKKYHRRVIIPAQGGGDIQAIALTLIVNKMAGEPDYQQQFSRAVERLVQPAPAVQSWEPKPDQYQVLANGTADIATGYNARGQFYVDQTGGRIGVSAPKEGTVAQVNVIAAVAGSEKMAATQTFINYALSEEAQAHFARLMYYAPTNTQVRLSDADKARIPLINNASPVPLINVDWSTIGDVREKILQPWRRQIIPAGR